MSPASQSGSPGRFKRPTRAAKLSLSKMLPGIYGDRSHLEVSGGLKVETLKDQAPEWLRERLAGGEVEVIEPPKTV